jgi:hypothetical protein
MIISCFESHYETNGERVSNYEKFGEYERVDTTKLEGPTTVGIRVR